MNKITPITLRILRGRVLLFPTRFFSSNSLSHKVCVVGSGPAGFYTAQHILKKSNADVDIFETLPVPFGLIRYGVAPDHPEIKVVTNSFTKVAEHERCRFFGNVCVGYDVKVSELLDIYNAVVLAFGPKIDNELYIPGEDSPNVFSAKKFVSWYNGHPDHVNDKYDLDTEVAAVIGHGNVALDVARILLKNPDELKTTDIAQHAMDSLLKSKIKKVVLIGRRGPLQAAFTIKEFREMIKLNGCSTIMSAKDFDGIPELMPSIPRNRKRLIELMYNTAMDNEMKQGDKTLEIKFFRRPKSILSEDGKVTKMILGLNTVDGTTENAKAYSTKGEDEVDCGLVLRSIGYKCLPIDSIIPFDPREFIVPNEAGRVTKKRGLYCSGWVKTGPYGVILSTMNGSYETAEKVVEDMTRERHFAVSGCSGDTVVKLLKKRGVRYTTFDDWLKIDKVELERGKAAGKSREKICDIEEMLQIAGV